MTRSRWHRGARQCARLFAVPFWLRAGSAFAQTGLGLKPADDGQLLFGGLKAVAFGLLCLLVVGIALRTWRRRMMPALVAPAGDAVPLLQSSRRITQKTVLLVVRWQGRVYLLAESNGGICEIDSAAVEETTP